MVTRTRRLILLASVVILAAGVSLSGALKAWAAAGGAISTSADTTSYTIDLMIGPTAQMMTPDRAQGATSGEVMTEMPEATVDSINADRMPVNHHLEVHIRNRATGAVMSNVTPVISVTNHTTGVTYTLDRIVTMYDVTAGKQDLHFGRNIYLPPATYSVKVVVGRGERVLFDDITVTGAARAYPVQ